MELMQSCYQENQQLENTQSNLFVQWQQSLNVQRKHKTILRILKDRSRKIVSKDITNAIGVSVGYTALNLDLHTIVTYTESGITARLISKYRPTQLS